MRNNFEELVAELFQHLEFANGDWLIDTEQGYVPVRIEVSGILDELETELQNGAYVEEDIT